MRCALVFYLVVTIFAIVYSSLSELCVFRGYFHGKRALCGTEDIRHTFEFIPPISQNISYIDLGGQPLKQLSYNGFWNLSSQSSISVIWLQACQISYVDAGAFLDIHNLTAIDLSYNYINQIDKQVYLNNNRIHQLERFSFKNTPSLRIIDLEHNQVEFMTMLFKDKLYNLTTLRLYGNPWKCNCELGPLYEFLTKINQLNQYELVCEMPATLQGRNWSDISRDEFVCLSEDTVSTQDSVMTSTEPMITAEQDDNILATATRTDARDMDGGLLRRVVQSSAVSENGVSGSKLANGH